MHTKINAHTHTLANVLLRPLQRGANEPGPNTEEQTHHIHIPVTSMAGLTMQGGLPIVTALFSCLYVYLSVSLATMALCLCPPAHSAVC